MDRLAILWSRAAKLGTTLASAGAEERRFAMLAWLAAPWVELALAAAGLHQTLRWVESASRPRSGPAQVPDGSVTVEQGTCMVNLAYRLHLLRGACLPRSLLQYGLHRRAGLPVRFVVGVRRGQAQSDPPLAAHAWVEPLDDDPAATAPQEQGAGFETLMVREAPTRPEVRSLAT